jgi:hypothetical protein
MEVRTGFEFHENRLNFYPPPEAMSRVQHIKHESIFSMASISSYGQVINNGLMDPLTMEQFRHSPAFASDLLQTSSPLHLLLMIHFHSSADSLIGNALTVMPQASTSLHQDTRKYTLHSCCKSSLP